MRRRGYLTGMTGVYYTAAELSSRGFIVAVTSRNAPGVDIVATKGWKRFDIQVKANWGNSNFWLLSKRAIKDTAPNFFYVFVNLNKHRKDKTPPDFYIVKSSEVAKKLRVRHRKKSIWYSFPRREEDKDRWDLLK